MTTPQISLKPCERIYSRCPACGNDTLTINSNKHLLCTWIGCPDPVLIDRLWPRQPERPDVRQALEDLRSLARKSLDDPNGGKSIWSSHVLEVCEAALAQPERPDVIPIEALTEIVDRATADAELALRPDGSECYQHGDGARRKKWRKRLQQCKDVHRWLAALAQPEANGGGEGDCEYIANQVSEFRRTSTFSLEDLIRCAIAFGRETKGGDEPCPPSLTTGCNAAPGSDPSAAASKPEGVPSRSTIGNGSPPHPSIRR